MGGAVQVRRSSGAAVKSAGVSETASDVLPEVEEDGQTDEQGGDGQRVTHDGHVEEDVGRLETAKHTSQIRNKSQCTRLPWLHVKHQLLVAVVNTKTSANSHRLPDSVKKTSCKG